MKVPLRSAQPIVLYVLMLVLAPVWIPAALAAERRFETDWDSSDSLASAPRPMATEAGPGC